LTAPELGELLGLPKEGRRVHRLVHTFPKLVYVPKPFHILIPAHEVLSLEASVQPITRSLLRIDLTITPDFQWDADVHGGAEQFHILVEDVDGEVILFHDTFVLRQRYAQDEHSVTLTVPMFEPVPPNYYISLVSDRWLHAETRLPISFKHLILPEKFPAPTPLLDLQSLPLTALHNKEFEAIYAKTIQTFNKIQTQVFQALYTSDENVFIGAPTGSGKTICAEFALMRLWSAKKEQRRAVCIEPYQDMVDMRVKEWTAKFANVQGGKEIVSLTGETSADLRALEKGDVIVCTPTQVRPFSFSLFNRLIWSTLVGCHLKKVEAAEERPEHRSVDRGRDSDGRRRGWTYLRGRDLEDSLRLGTDRHQDSYRRLWRLPRQRS